VSAVPIQPVSCGLLLYRRHGDSVEVLIAHPGGPFWAKKDVGAWTIPKGLAELGEDEEQAARREFTEETGAAAPAELVDLGTVVQKAGKTVHAFAGEGDLDPAAAVSNMVTIAWPPRSGRTIEVPEVDRVVWVAPGEARRLLNPAQGPLVDRLVSHLATSLR
jgi:predicted NUDIX family NTP pyrophosphohydrolase